MAQSFRTRLRLLAKDWLGLDVMRVSEPRSDVGFYDMNVKLTRRLLHFEAMLTELEDVNGRIVECGVGPGGSLFAFAVITQCVTRSREIVAFDTFDGMPPPTLEDGPENRNMTGWWRFSVDEVVDRLKHNGLADSFIEANVSFRPGLLKDTLPAYDGSPIALLHLDVDFYESYKVALRELWRYVAPGGIVAFDEYGKSVWPGATRAVDEFFEGRREGPVKSHVADYHYVIKAR